MPDRNHGAGSWRTKKAPNARTRRITTVLPAAGTRSRAWATIWDLTEHRCGAGFFAGHTIAELQDWRDHDLEAQGRLTHPMRFDPGSGRYVEASWEKAFAAIGAGLRRLDPKSVVFYTSGRASLETSFLWQLFARLYGHNNLPDSSNMCHETTSAAFKKVIGSPVGTCVLDDFEHCDLILGENTGSNSPRFLHQLEQAVKRGCRIVTLNPVREAGLLRFSNPQNPPRHLGGFKTAQELGEMIARRTGAKLLAGQ